jgi:uncharacterized protein YbjQ (UPF0145 family)
LGGLPAPTAAGLSLDRHAGALEALRLAARGADDTALDELEEPAERLCGETVVDAAGVHDNSVALRSVFAASRIVVLATALTLLVQARAASRREAPTSRTR